MLEQALQSFFSFPTQARTWVYQADKNLSHEEIQFIESNLAHFISTWQAHGKPLKAQGKVVFNRFLVIMVDENRANATGCSIDSSVHFVQQMGKTLMIDWFNRMKVVYQTTDYQNLEFDFRDAPELFEANIISAQTLIFNNNIASKGDLLENWLQPIGQSWLARQLNLA